MFTYSVCVCTHLTQLLSSMARLCGQFITHPFMSRVPTDIIRIKYKDTIFQNSLPHQQIVNVPRHHSYSSGQPKPTNLVTQF
jgi:hypothetical protein